MKIPNPFIELHWVNAIVDRNIFVVQIVMIVSDVKRDSLAQYKTIKSEMCQRRSKCQVLQKIKAMQWMGWNDPKQNNRGEIQEMFNRMHG